MRNYISIRVIAGMLFMLGFSDVLSLRTKMDRSFEKEPLMITVETGHYVKGMHNLLNALFDLRYYQKFKVILQKFEAYAETPVARHHDNFRIHTFIYIYGAKINQHLMLGTFKEALSLVPYIEEKLKEYAFYIDKHRILVDYKIANLYFGSGD